MTASRRVLAWYPCGPHQSMRLAELHWETMTSTSSRRNHVALAAWSAGKSDIGGNEVFDSSAQIIRLKGATVLLVMVYSPVIIPTFFALSCLVSPGINYDFPLQRA